MDDLLLKGPFSGRPYLESLTNDELISLADRFGIDIPPELERIFIIEGLLDIAAEEAEASEEEAQSEETALVEADIHEPVPLPRQYNITFIEVMIRDPLWVFTFWEVKNHDKELYEKAADFEGYHLKVSPLAMPGVPEQDNSFTVPVGISDTAWYLGFPPSGGRFKVELCVSLKNEAIVLATSHPFKLPKLFDAPNLGEAESPPVYENPLLQLSGMEDFPVLRNGDRPPRIKRHD
jgi:hypothetical protein